METLNLLLDGFGIALTLDNFILALIGCILGTIFGALPGLGPANGVAILIPLSFSLGLSAASSMILLASVYYGAMYGGRISSILLNIPGDEPALMTTLDGYPMTQQGRAGEALTLTGLASFFGAMFATVGLVLLAPQLVKVAFLFGPAEYFALFVMAFATLGGVASNNQAKTVLASCLGLGISTIGVDHQTGVPRMSYGEIDLYDGIDFLVVIVGMFAVSEVFIFIENHKSGKEQTDNKPIIGNIIPKMFTVIKTIPSMIRGTFLGFFAGVLPGAGASLGSFIAYTFEKKISNKEDTFGKGDERGV
ncbi:MAG: tripartite tricarboxylate transporter permease, partial [Pelagibacteraceae bacterium]